MARAEGAGDCRLEQQGEGRYRLSGDLGYAAAADLLERGRSAFAGGREARVDLSGVTDADSAGLAVLLEWVHLARREGREIRFLNVPRRMTDLARIGGVAEFLPAGEERRIADSG